mmetsp:Transcript_70180/g.86119  ORF Transcript_70180/g.86119 Transcript_70180/m.86119 type:complete len:131 (-) Transcript_70180:49-441(-)
MSGSSIKKDASLVGLRLGDVILIEGHRLCIVRYIGKVLFDKNNIYIGVELKGHRDKIHGCNGTINGKSYFKTKHEYGGLFLKKIVRKIMPEELLMKVAELNEQLLLCSQNNKNNKFGGTYDDNSSSNEDE